MSYLRDELSQMILLLEMSNQSKKNYELCFVTRRIKKIYKFNLNASSERVSNRVEIETNTIYISRY